MLVHPAGHFVKVHLTQHRWCASHAGSLLEYHYRVYLRLSDATILQCIKTFLVFKLSIRNGSKYPACVSHNLPPHPHGTYFSYTLCAASMPQARLNFASEWDTEELFTYTDRSESHLVRNVKYLAM